MAATWARRNRMPPRIVVRALAIGLVLTALVATSACRRPGAYIPSMSSAAGYRDDGGTLRIWTGTPCPRVTKIDIFFGEDLRGGTDPPDDELNDGFQNQRLVLTAPAPGVTVEYLDLDRPDPALTVEHAPAEGFDWRDAGTVSLIMDRDGPSWGSTVYVADIIAGSADHDADTYLFGSLGWKDQSDVDRENGTKFLTVCTEDPGKNY